MTVSSNISDVFGHFQNLNLLGLLQDLRSKRTSHQAWSAATSIGTLLCPVSHGLPTGQQVHELNILGQAADLGRGCEYVARHLGANADAVWRFVRSWDDESLGNDWLLHQVQAIWDERLADAEAVQRMLCEKNDGFDAVSDETSPELTTKLPQHL